MVITGDTTTTEEVTMKFTTPQPTRLVEDAEADLTIPGPKVKEPVLARVRTQTIGGASVVSLSPLEITDLERQQLISMPHSTQVLTMHVCTPNLLYFYGYFLFYEHFIYKALLFYLIMEPKGRVGQFLPVNVDIDPMFFVMFGQHPI